MSHLATLSGVITAGLLATSAAAFDGAVPYNKQTNTGLYLTALEAAEMVSEPGVLFLDVRTRAEVAFVGMPQEVDIHIPFMVLSENANFDPAKGQYSLTPNPDFASTFEAYAMDADIESDMPIVVICRSGSRSAKAANLLSQLGFTQVYTIIDGFEGDKAKDGVHAGHRVVNGWRNAGLPWSHTIRGDQLSDASMN